MLVALAGWLRLRREVAAQAPATVSPVLMREGATIVVPEASPLRRTIVVAPVAQEAVQVPFALPASVEADPSKLVKVLPPVSGRIASLNKVLGDSVKAGDVLFRLESADLSQALSDAQKAKSAITLAKQTLERQRQLGESDIAARRDVEQAQNDFEQASSELARANAKLAQIGAGLSGSMEGRLLAVRSPISGRVVDLAAANGAFWNDVTAPLLTVADLSTVYVTANADEADLANIFVGQETKITLNAYPDEPLTGKVRYVGEILDSDTRRVKVRVVVENRSARLKPGMFAQAMLFAKPHPSILVPKNTVVQNGFSSRVFVEVAAWRFEPRVVQLGATIGDRVEILGGLKAGARVVTSDGVLLND
jgi:cobalt-zinc-cadmium efflux system membrane fusion protein